MWSFSNGSTHPCELLAAKDFVRGVFTTWDELSALATPLEQKLSHHETLRLVGLHIPCQLWHCPISERLLVETESPYLVPISLPNRSFDIAVPIHRLIATPNVLGLHGQTSRLHEELKSI
uniref:Retrovirus-related Pol polyprotein from transposon 17.6 n=1 Tax=Mesocestoides corti TaxID=53468 RepID=A0A5K3EZ56_MESCO